MGARITSASWSSDGPNSALLPRTATQVSHHMHKNTLAPVFLQILTGSCCPRLWAERLSCRRGVGMGSRDCRRLRRAVPLRRASRVLTGCPRVSPLARRRPWRSMGSGGACAAWRRRIRPSAVHPRVSKRGPSRRMRLGGCGRAARVAVRRRLAGCWGRAGGAAGGRSWRRARRSFGPAWRGAAARGACGGMA